MNIFSVYTVFTSRKTFRIGIRDPRGIIRERLGSIRKLYAGESSGKQISSRWNTFRCWHRVENVWTTVFVDVNLTIFVYFSSNSKWKRLFLWFACTQWAELTVKHDWCRCANNNWCSSCVNQHGSLSLDFSKCLFFKRFLPRNRTGEKTFEAPENDSIVTVIRAFSLFNVPP